MKKNLEKFIHCAFYIFVFLLPWQTRWIYREAELNGGIWEYGRLSLYFTEVILLIILLLAGILLVIKFNRLNKEQRRKELINEIKGSRLITLLIIVWCYLSIFWSANKLVSWYSFLKLIEGAGIYWLLTSKLLDLKLKKISLALIFSAVVQALFSLAQFIWQWSPASKWLGLSLHGPIFSGTSVIETNFIRILRSYGSLPHPNILAGFLVISLWLLIILIIKNNLEKQYYYLLSLVMVILTSGLFFTFSRASWLALFISLLIYWVFLRIKQLSLKKFFLGASLIAVVFIILSLANYSLIITRLTGGERLEIKSNQERLSGYQQVFSIISHNWLLGVGNGNYTYQLYQNNPDQTAWDYQPVHDTLLLILAELGIIGLTLFIILIISVFKNKSHYWPALVAVIILGLFDHYFKSLYIGLILWWLVLGFNRLENV